MNDLTQYRVQIDGLSPAQLNSELTRLQRSIDDCLDGIASASTLRRLQDRRRIIEARQEEILMRTLCAQAAH
jgi:hypothetical protein